MKGFTFSRFGLLIFRLVVTGLFLIPLVFPIGVSAEHLSNGGYPAYNHPNQIFRVQTSLPILNVSISPETWTNAVVTVTIEAENSADTAHIYCKTNSESDWTDSGSQPCTKTLTANGEVYYWAENTDGDKTGTAENPLSIRIDHIDTTPPLVNVDGPVEDWVSVKTGKQITAQASDDQSGINRLYCKLASQSEWISGEVVSSTDGVETWECSHTAYSNDTFFYYLSDRAGNTIGSQEAPISIPVTNIDSTNPVVVPSVSTTNWTNEDVVVTLTATDPESGVESIEWGLESESSVTTTEQSGSVQITLTENDTVLFTARDKAGHLSSTKPASIRITNIDKTPPTLGYSGAKPGKTYKTPQVIVPASKDNDGGSGIKVQYVSATDGDWKPAVLVSEPSDIYCYAEDNAGNVATGKCGEVDVRLSISHAATCTVDGENGCTLKDASEKLKIEIPAGAVSEPALVYLFDYTTSPYPVPESQIDLKRFSVLAVDGNGRLEKFSVPYTITYSYSDSEVERIMESTLSFGYYDDGSDQWLSLMVDDGGFRGISSNLVGVNLNQFGEFILAGKEAKPVKAKVKVFDGALYLEPAPLVLANVTLNGVDQMTSGSVDWYATDATGTGDGWYISIAATDFYNENGQIISLSGFSVRLPQENIREVAGNALPVSQITEWQSLATTSLVMVIAEIDSGMGKYLISPEFNLVIPAETFAGFYTTTLLLTIIPGG